jgi:aryl-alcohol dehydrogenase-like predicted oxidoreductase
MSVIILTYMAVLGCSTTHLALAWLAGNTNTSTVILGASRPEQVVDNLKALDIIPKLTPEILEAIENILGNKPEPPVSWLRYTGGSSALLCV